MMAQDTFYLLLIPLLPLLGAMYNGFFGGLIQRKLDKSYVHFPAIATVVLSFVLSFIGLIKLASDSSVTALYANAWQWMSIGTFKINLAFVMDHLSAVMCLFITFVGSLIHIYSTGYMKDDPGYWRFFAYLNLFMFSMLVLVLGDNFFVMFIGWEGVGLCSYLLIGFWYKDINNAKAGSKAFIVNRIGDFGFVIGIFMLFWTLASLSDPSYTQSGQFVTHASLVFHDIEATLHDETMRQAFLAETIFSFSFTKLVWIALFIGFAIKIPMFPFHTWLPDAHVEAPTPVSVILAGILLKTGAYGILRFNFGIFPEASAFFASGMAIFGMINIVYAAYVCMAQTDLKKLIAYSSVSHMGFVLLGYAAFTPQGISGAMFQMVAHGLISPMLFLIAGVIYDRTHTREIEGFGGLASKMPEYTGLMGLAFMASLGLPGLAGFVGEILVLLGAFPVFKLFTIISATAMIITAAYYLWTIQRMFLGEFNTRWEALKDLNMRERVVLYPLAFFTILFGVYPMPVFHLVNNALHNLVSTITPYAG